MKINTVLGQIDSKDLGYTLMHEHILIANHTMRKVYPKWLVREEFIPFATGMVKQAKEKGVNTVVDVTPFELGRDLSVLQEVSEKSEVNIIAATGFYWQRQLFFEDKSVDFLSEILIEDITKGMEGTGYKANIIKYASNECPANDYEKKMAEAVAIAQRETGVPVYTHTANRNGMEQVRIFEELGVDLEKVIIGHVGDTTDIEYIEKIGKKGCYLGLDRFSSGELFPGVYLDSESRAEVAAKLCTDGFLNQIVMSHDICWFIDFQGGLWDDFKKIDIKTFPYQFTFLMNEVTPLLLKKGMTQEQIQKIMVDTPRRIFENCKVN